MDNPVLPNTNTWPEDDVQGPFEDLMDIVVHIKRVPRSNSRYVLENIATLWDPRSDVTIELTRVKEQDAN